MEVALGRDQCVLRGESVVIDCKYDYPFAHIVMGVSWSKSQQRSGNWELVQLPLSQNSGRFRYLSKFGGDCRLQINDVQPADAGSYFFSFRTTLAKWTTSRTPAQLSVEGNYKNKPGSKRLNHSSNFTLLPVIQC